MDIVYSMPPYDFIIVGAGPTGLTLAWLLSSKHKVALIDSAPTIGGCHRVIRDDGHFTEHGPRVYSSAYKTVESLLNNMDIRWDDIFTPYKFIMGAIGGRTWQSLHVTELLTLASAYVQLAFGRDYSKTSMREFTRDWSRESIDYIERICVLTDGQRADTYPVAKFLQLVNQQTGLYKLYQPKAPNDELLFAQWEQKLRERGVTFHLATECTAVREGEVVTTRGTFTANNIILATPPRTLARLGLVSQEYAAKTSYIDYITVNFEFMLDKGQTLPPTWGFPATAWGLAHIVVSDYWDGDHPLTISCGITNVDAPDRNGKTARTSDDNYVIASALEQLRESYPLLLEPTSAKIGSRIGQESAFVGTDFIPHAMKPGIYNAGTQNGKAQYAYTSMETAVANGAAMANMFGCGEVKPVLAWTLNQAILLAIAIICIVCLCAYVFTFTLQQQSQVQLQAAPLA
jgi:protoporphyrinogen oxidase